MNCKLRKTPGETYYKSTAEDFVLNQYPTDIVEFLTDSDESTDEFELQLQKSVIRLKRTSFGRLT